MLAADRTRSSRLLPDAKTFNIMLNRAARRKDATEAKRLVTLMKEYGVTADAFTISAISALRSPVLRHGSVEDLSAQEAEIDMILQRLVETRGASGQRQREDPNSTNVHVPHKMSPTTGPFNQVMQSYFRIGRPDKALGVLDVMEQCKVGCVITQTNGCLWWCFLATACQNPSKISIIF
jgi:pentatricopeptide repeat protein